MSRKKIHVMITAFRDGFQSVFGARVFTKDFMPAVAATREAGITHFEAGGGARYQSLYFYCNEDAFDMMDTFRKTAGPDANLQTLARGINVVALDSQPRDIIDLHAKMFKKHGMTTIRNFDALNDVDNLIYSGQAITNAGLNHEVVISMMSLPPGCTGAHDPAFYMKTLRNILDADIPFTSVCFKDASGSSTPQNVYETIRQAREMLPEGTHISFHTHDTAGNGVLCYMSAIQAGVDQIDLSMAPVSGGTSQPDVASMWHALRGTDWDLDLDIDKMMEAEEVFKDCMKDYFIPPESLTVEPLIPWSPMPGGALTANTQMMRDNNIMDKYPSVINAMGEVVRRGGYGTSVTPVSQFYFQQAFNNVMFGEWEKFADGYGKMVLGYFGKTPVPPDPEIVKLASEKMGLPVVTESPLEINERDPDKGVPAARKLLQKNNLEETDENIFIAASCKEKGIAFLKGEATIGVRKISKEEKPSQEPSDSFVVKVSGHAYKVDFKDGKAVVDGQSYEVAIADEHALSDAPSPSGKGAPVVSPMAGIILEVKKNVGDFVKEGAPIVTLEAMKMEMVVNAPQTGTIQAIHAKKSDQVTAGQELATIA